MKWRKMIFFHFIQFQFLFLKEICYICHVLTYKTELFQYRNDMMKYINSGANSFDYALRDFDHDKKVFAYPILLSENFGVVVRNCLLSEFHKEGVYLRNDVIFPEKNCESFYKHTLICDTYNRYYTSYSVQEHNSIHYRFYSKTANHLIFNLFNEEAFPPPFDLNKFVKIYEGNNWLGISESLYNESKEKQIKEDDVIGFVCCDLFSLEHKKDESILYMLTREPIEYRRSNNFNLFDSSYQKVYIESKYLKSYASKVITWSLIFELQKKAGIDSKGLVINDENETQQLLHFIQLNYNLMNDCEKDICAYIVPETYKLTDQAYIKRDWLRYLTTNAGSFIREDGLKLAVSMPFSDKPAPKLMDTLISTVDKCKMFFLSPEIDYQIDAILNMVLINLRIGGPYKSIAGLYAFYHLINLKNKQESNLVNELLLIVYSLNPRLFMNLISNIKSVRGLLRNNVTTWALYDDEFCYMELLYEYSNNGEGFELSEEEKTFICPELLSQIKLDAGDIYFREYPSVHHTYRYIDKERLFFRQELEKYIINNVNSI